MKTLIVVPCFNEAQRLNTREFARFIDQHSRVHFCFVNDGSKDNTVALIQALKKANPENVYLVNLQKNRGKAEAVRQGMIWGAENDYALIGFWDADLAVPLNELPRLLEKFQDNSELLIVLASRVKLLGYNIVRKAYRHYIGRVFATFASLLVKMPVYDTQCGAKVFKRETIQPLFSQKFISSWIFDVEILLRFRQWLRQKDAEKYINEVPLLAWQEIAGSKIKLKHYFLALLDFFKLYFKYRL